MNARRYKHDREQEAGDFVALEQKQCFACGKLYQTGNLFFDMKMRGSLPGSNVCTGMGLCPEHQKYVDAGYVILIEVANKPEKDVVIMQPDEAERTGNICFVKKDVATSIFGAPFTGIAAFVEIGIMDKLREIKRACAGEAQNESYF